MEKTKIAEARKAYGLTQADISTSLGIPLRTISNWERGVNKPPEYVEYLVLYWMENEYSSKLAESESEAI